MASKSTLPNAVASLVVTKLPCVLLNMQGYWGGAADAWLQIHDSALTAAQLAGATPLKSYVMPAQSPFSWAFGEAGLLLANGCVIAISTTERTLTLAAASADIEVEYGPYPASTGVEPTAITAVTDETSGHIWPSGSHALMSAQVTNNEGVDGFLQLHAKTPTLGDYPLQVWPLKNGATIKLSFGSQGLTVQDGAGNHLAVLAISSTNIQYTSPNGAVASVFNATYL